MRGSLRISLIAVVSCAVIFRSKACDADTIVYGTWYGVESYSITDYDPFGMLVGESSGSNVPAYLGITLDSSDSLDMVISNNSVPDLSILSVTGPVYTPFGPTSASAEVSEYQSFYPYAEIYIDGNYALTYTSILPDGQIDTSTGGAVADLASIEVFADGSQELVQALFISVPEPSSLVMAAPAFLIILIFAPIRSLGRRLPCAMPI
jgi:hypothetical protein